MLVLIILRDFPCKGAWFGGCHSSFPPVVKVEGWTMLAPQKSQAAFRAANDGFLNLDFSEAKKCRDDLACWGAQKGGGN